MLRLLANGFAIASISSNILELINLLFTVCVTTLVPFTVTQERMFYNTIATWTHNAISNSTLYSQKNCRKEKGG